MGIAGKSMFENYRTKVLNKQEDEKNQSRDERILSMKSGNTYRWRLIFYVNPAHKRQEPFIEKWSHAYYEEDTKASDWVTCPTTDYISGRAGFKMCPICANNSKLWKDYEAGSAAAKELYNKFKRRFVGFALVYVVKDPITPENDGRVKIVKYGKGMSEFLKKEILGTGDESSEPIRAAAFDITAGYDMIVTVGTKDTEFGKFNSYDYKFAREKTALNISAEELEKQVAELNFDESFYTQSSKEDLLKFYKKWVVDEDSPAEQKPEQKQAATQPPPKVEQPKQEVKESAPATTTAPAPTTAPAANQTSNATTQSDFNVDSILDEIENGK